MQREITDLQPDPMNPAVSRVAFADGSAYSLPTATIRPLYEQQMAARRGQMTAQAPVASNAQMMARDFSTPLQVPAFNRPQPPNPQLASFAAQQGEPGLARRPAPAPVSYTPPQAPAQQQAPVRAADTGQIQQGNSQGIDSADLAEIQAIRRAGHNWTLQDEAEHALHPEMSRAQLLAYRSGGGGRPAVTEQQLRAAAAQSVPIPVSQSVTVQGKAPVSDKELQGVTDAQIKAADASAVALQSEAEAKRAAAEAQAIASQNDYERQRHELAVREADWNDKWGRLQAQLDPNNEANQVNPDRYMQDKGAMGGILAMLGGFFKGMAAGWNRTQAGPTMIDRAIERDIRAQEVDIQTRRASANSQLMQLSQQWGSLDAGKAALEVAQRQAIQNKLASLQMARMDPAVAKNIEAFRAENEAKITEKAAQLKAVYGGSISETQQSQMMRPQAASYGGPRYSEKAIQGGLAAGREEARKDAAIGNETIRPEQANQLGEIEVGRQKILTLGKAMGLEYDPATNEFVAPPGWKNPIAGVVEGESMRAGTRFATDEQKKIRALQNSAIMEFGKPIFGNMSKDERSQAEGLIKGDDPTSAPFALNSALQTLQVKKESWGGGVANPQRKQVAKGIRREQSISRDEPLTPKVK